MDARILRVTPDLYPYSWGGIAVHTYLMSTYQAKAGHAVTVLTVRDSDCRSHRSNNFEVVRFPGFRDPLGNPLMPGILSYVRENIGQFDIVHVHSQLFFSSLFALWARSGREIPAVLTCHGVRSSSIPFFLSDLYLRTVTHAMLARVQAVLCYSDNDADLLARLAHSSSDQMHIVPNGVPLDMFRPSRFSATKEPVILWAGRMVRQKGVDLILRAMKHVVEAVPASRLVLVGSGPDLPAIKAEINRLGLNRLVDLPGNQPFEDMPKFYAKSAVCVVSSTTEGMPRTLMEATAAGVPVVATRLPQLSSFSNKGVLLFESGSVSELASCITKVLTDTRYAVELSGDARKLAEEEFDWGRTVSMTSQLCERVASQPVMVG